MIPITRERPRPHLRDWPVGELRQAIAAALPDLDPVTVALVADRLLADVSDPQLALIRSRGQVDYATAFHRP